MHLLHPKQPKQGLSRLLHPSHQVARPFHLRLRLRIVHRLQSMEWLFQSMVPSLLLMPCLLLDLPSPRASY
ncbi:MAG: hypothetical protein Q8P67_05220 [archaeon]|nr:hypothetical protein [archaeon]